LVARVLVRVVIGVFGLFVAWVSYRWMGRLSARLSPIEHVGFIIVFLGLPATVGALFLAGIPARIRAIAGGDEMERERRIAWTRSALWSDAARYPDGQAPWSDYETVDVARVGSAIRLTFRPIRPVRQPPSTIWIPGDEADAAAIRDALPAERGGA
jgi:hypothetical protein